jgi:hypothetical protein
MDRFCKMTLESQSAQAENVTPVTNVVSVKQSIIKLQVMPSLLLLKNILNSLLLVDDVLCNEIILLQEAETILNLENSLATKDKTLSWLCSCIKIFNEINSMEDALIRQDILSSAKISFELVLFELI